jgi:hypothetical protein
MNKANIENIRSKLKGIAVQRFGLASTYYDGACIAVDMLCDAKIAEADLVSNSISSYSIQGRSITKRNIADIPWHDLLADCLLFFNEDEIPFRLTGNVAIQVDFSGGLR